MIVSDGTTVDLDLTRVYYPNRKDVPFSWGLIALGIGLWYANWTVKHSLSPNSTIILSLGGVAKLMVAYTRTLTLSDSGITNHSIYGTRTVRFDDVALLKTESMVNRSMTGTTTRIEGNGLISLTISSDMDGYDDVVSFIRSKVPKASLESVK